MIYDMCIVYYISMSLIICDVIIIICNVFCLYKDGETPLMISVQNRNMDICKLLLDNGALPSINTSNDVNI
jgi:hypothetical protein